MWGCLSSHSQGLRSESQVTWGVAGSTVFSNLDGDQVIKLTTFSDEKLEEIKKIYMLGNRTQKNHGTAEASSKMRFKGIRVKLTIEG